MFLHHPLSVFPHVVQVVTQDLVLVSQTVHNLSSILNPASELLTQVWRLYAVFSSDWRVTILPVGLSVFRITLAADLKHSS